MSRSLALALVILVSGCTRPDSLPVLALADAARAFRKDLDRAFPGRLEWRIAAGPGELPGLAEEILRRSFPSVVVLGFSERRTIREVALELGLEGRCPGLLAFELPPAGAQWDRMHPMLRRRICGVRASSPSWTLLAAAMRDCEPPIRSVHVLIPHTATSLELEEAEEIGAILRREFVDWEAEGRTSPKLGEAGDRKKAGARLVVKILKARVTDPPARILDSLSKAGADLVLSIPDPRMKGLLRDLVREKGTRPLRFLGAPWQEGLPGIALVAGPSPSRVLSALRTLVAATLEGRETRVLPVLTLPCEIVRPARRLPKLPETGRRKAHGRGMRGGEDRGREPAGRDREGRK